MQQAATYGHSASVGACIDRGASTGTTGSGVSTGSSSPVRDFSKEPTSGWPYGRTAITAGVGAGAEWGLGSDNVADYWEEQVPGTQVETPSFFVPLTFDASLRILPRLMLGGLFTLRRGPKHFEGESLQDSTQSINLWGNLFAGFVRYVPVSTGDGGQFELYIEAGGGMARASGTFRPDPDNEFDISGSGPFFFGEVGVDLVSEDVIGFNVFTRLRSATIDKLENESAGTSLTLASGENVNLNLVGWEVIGAKLLIGF